MSFFASPSSANDLSGRYEASDKSTGPLLLARRAYKSDAVRSPCSGRPAVAVSQSGDSSSGGRVFDVSVGDRMAAGQGGYTVQLPPATAPQPPSWAARLYSTVRFGAEQILAFPIMRVLRDSVTSGCILLRTPDGWETAFGDCAAPAPLRARIRIHSWAFFLRCAAEADVGLGRSFIAGEWSADDLAAFFRVIIASRENAVAAAKPAMHQSLWSAWLGRAVNHAALVFGHDNSRYGARSTISAHYDLSNDLFTAFLDPVTMMYSSAFFPTTRRYVRSVDLHSLPSSAAEMAAPRQTLEAAAAAVELAKKN